VGTVYIIKNSRQLFGTWPITFDHVIRYKEEHGSDLPAVVQGAAGDSISMMFPFPCNASDGIGETPPMR
jgi:hypothetical protein